MGSGKTPFHLSHPPGFFPPLANLSWEEEVGWQAGEGCLSLASCFPSSQLASCKYNFKAASPAARLGAFSTSSGQAAAGRGVSFWRCYYEVGHCLVLHLRVIRACYICITKSRHINFTLGQFSEIQLTQSHKNSLMVLKGVFKFVSHYWATLPAKHFNFQNINF